MVKTSTFSLEFGVELICTWFKQSDYMKQCEDLTV